MRLAIVLLAACGAPSTPGPSPITAQSPIDAAPVPIEHDERDEDHVLPVEPEPRGKVVVITSDACGMIIETVYFDQNSATPASNTAVDGIADMLTCVHKDSGLLLKLAIQGYADPSEKDPDQLSLRRARTVAAMLTARKMPTLGAFEIVPHGARDLRDTSGSADGRARNRRTEFLILERKTTGE